MAINLNSSANKSATPSRGPVHIRLMGRITRRGFNKGMVALGAGALASSASRTAKAATEIKYTGWQGYDAAANAGGFLDKNGLVLQTTYIEANDQIPALAHSGGLGSMDLVTPSAYYVPLNVRGGVLQPLDKGRLPNLKGVMPFFQNVHDLNIDGKTYGVPFAWGSCPLMYNADVVKNVPTSWADLFKDEYKGKVAVTADLTGITIPMASLATGTKTPWLLTQSELSATIDLLIKFKREHARTIAPSYGDLANLLGSGEVIMAQGWEPVSAWMGDNAPTVKWVVPKEGCCTFIESYGIAVDAPHEDADYEIVNHVISPEGQAHAAEANSIAVTVADAVPLLSPAVKNIYPYDDIPGYFARAGGVTPLYPLDSDGTHVTYDEVLKGWERFMAA